MLRPALIAASLILGPAAATQADAPRDQLRAAVARDLPIYMPDVDVDSLSRSQLSTIYSILHSSRSAGDKTALIRSALGGRNSLRGLLFGSN
jgi:hypothetical protein